MVPPVTPTLAEGVFRGDPHALSRAISQVENATEEGLALIKELSPRTGKALRIGLTGPPGVGKSTMVDALTTLYRAKGGTVGVIAVDPTSPFSGGALLGDRIRMHKIAEDEGVFMRSMATRGCPGGLSRAAQDAADLLDASGKQTILIESVGVGQSEIEISRATDCVLLLLSPESGDGIQAMKSGILEIADIVVINKADRTGADKLEYELRSAFELGLRNRRDVPIFLTEAFRGQGVPELLAGIDTFIESRRPSGAFKERRRQNMELRLRGLVEFTIQRSVWNPATLEKLSRLVDDVLAARQTPYGAAEAIVREVLS